MYFCVPELCLLLLFLQLLAAAPSAAESSQYAEIIVWALREGGAQRVACLQYHPLAAEVGGEWGSWMGGTSVF